MQRKPKRVRDTSLWKFHHTDGREVWGISPMCPDMGSACYSTHDTPGGCVDTYILIKYLEKLSFYWVDGKIKVST